MRGFDTVIAVQALQTGGGFSMSQVPTKELDGLWVKETDGGVLFYQHNKYAVALNNTVHGCTLVEPVDSALSKEGRAYFVPRAWLISGTEEEMKAAYAAHNLHLFLQDTKEKMRKRVKQNILMGNHKFTSEDYTDMVKAIDFISDKFLNTAGISEGDLMKARGIVLGACFVFGVFNWPYVIEGIESDSQ